MSTERQQSWERDGLFVIRKRFRAEKVAALMAACDHILGKQRASSRATGHTSTHVGGMLAPELYTERPEALELLVELASSRDVVGLISDLQPPQDGPLTLRDVQYFHEPSARDYDGDWHRDNDLVALPRTEETKEPTLLRFRIACAHDDHLEYIPGSHRRADTEQELRHRRGNVRNAPIATAVRIELDPGDVCVFDTCGIHRARYRHGTQRRTLDLLYRFGSPKIVLGESVRRLMAAK